MQTPLEFYLKTQFKTASFFLLFFLQFIFILCNSYIWPPEGSRATLPSVNRGTTEALETLIS